MGLGVSFAVFIDEGLRKLGANSLIKSLSILFLSNTNLLHFNFVFEAKGS